MQDPDQAPDPEQDEQTSALVVPGGEIEEEGGCDNRCIQHVEGRPEERRAQSDHQEEQLQREQGEDGDRDLRQGSVPVFACGRS